MKRTAILLAILALLAAGSAFAEEVEEKIEVKTPDKMDGKELYKTYCKVCHGAESEAGEYTPMSLIMDQWDEFFDGVMQETHEKVGHESTGDKSLLEFLDKDMIKKLRKFCIDHAADSEQPMSCG